MGKIKWNTGWRFCEQFNVQFCDAAFDDMGWKEVVLPHTVKELPFHYFDESEYQMVSTYRKRFIAEPAWKDKSVSVTFEGAAHKAEIFLNGEKLTEHECGYTAFSIELSDKLRYGEENVLVVKLDSRETLNVPPFGYVIDYMTYGGLYRDVTLSIREKMHMKDVFVYADIQSISSNAKEGNAKLYVEVTLSKEVKNPQLMRLMVDKKLLIQAKAESGSRYMLEAEIDKVALWDVEHPVLSDISLELVDEGRVIDCFELRFGFRKAEFRTDGFYLNDRKLRIRGLNRHQSYPYVGYAMPESMQKLDADILKKELGCNAVRTSHYPQSHDFINRCDEIGLLVFTEIPGWQHIGDAKWKDIAVQNVEEMVLQYRNHTSIILWGVRINESGDDEEFYRRTNEVAHQLDCSRPTGGVRAHQKSQLLEDVYTYNDFVHDGTAPGCQSKAKVTSDRNKPYLVTEYNGHMYPTKMFDWEEHRMEHTLRHIRVLDAIAGQEDIAGSFGWCMFDYNTHKDFGSGDRICYHGVMDMFRNPKMAALAYSCQQEKEPVLEITSSMDIGEHPGCNRGYTYILTNADSVRMYKNDVLIKEYKASDSEYKNLLHGPIVIDDFIGNKIHQEENFTKHQADIIKDAMNYTAMHGNGNYPLRIKLNLLWCVLHYHMKPTEAIVLYNKYVGDWGGAATTYRFEAIKDGKVVKTLIKEPVKSINLSHQVSHTVLKENGSYDVALVRIKAVDQNGNVLPFCNEPLTLETEGPIEIIGPKTISLKGGQFGLYVKTIGESGLAKLRIRSTQFEEVAVTFTVEKE